jgi:SAM-dependent methyltransferase
MKEVYHTLWAPQIYTLEGLVYKPFLNGAKALDVGCGGRKLPGAVGMDSLALPGVDIVHDMHQTPWPFPDQSFDLIFFNHVLEHAVDVVKTMDEVHRILKPGGHVVIQVPYFRSVDAFTDPTHKHFFTAGSLDYFVKGTKLSDYHYSKEIFKKAGFWYGWPHPSKNPLRQLLKSYIHKRPDIYDKYISRIYTIRCVTWELEKI